MLLFLQRLELFSIANCLEMHMAYGRDLRLRTLDYAQEGRTLAKATAVFKVNIGTLHWCEKAIRGNRRGENASRPPTRA